MGAIEDIRNLFQDVIAPDIKAIKVQLTGLEDKFDRQFGAVDKQFVALEKKIDSNHQEVMAAIGRIVDYKDVIQRLNKLEDRLPKQ